MYNIGLKMGSEDGSRNIPACYLCFLDIVVSLLKCRHLVVRYLSGNL